VHISELASHHVENPREVVSQGDPVNVLVLEIDGDRRRLSLSLKRVEDGAVPVPRADGAESVHSTPDLKLSEEAFPTSTTILLEDDLEVAAESETDEPEPAVETLASPENELAEPVTTDEAPSERASDDEVEASAAAAEPVADIDDAVASDPDEATKDAEQAEDIPDDEAADALNIDTAGDDEPDETEPDAA